MSGAPTAPTLALISALASSGAIFIYHKIDGRFDGTIGASCDAERPGSWMCRFPGLIVSHKRWTPGSGAVVCGLYVAVATGLAALVSLAARRAAARGGLTWQLAVVIVFSALWFAWAAFETHHVDTSVSRVQHGRSLKRGTVPAWLFTCSVLLVYTPVAIMFVLSTLHGPVSQGPIARPPG